MDADVKAIRQQYLTQKMIKLFVIFGWNNELIKIHSAMKLAEDKMLFSERISELLGLIDKYHSLSRENKIDEMVSEYFGYASPKSVDELMNLTFNLKEASNG